MLMICLTTQQKAFPDIEPIIEKTLSEMSAYYQENHLKANPSKPNFAASILTTNRKRDSWKYYGTDWN